MAVGEACTPTGASCLNLETCNRDREAAKTFVTPGTCRARNKILKFKQASTSRRTNTITVTSREVKTSCIDRRQESLQNGGDNALKRFIVHRR